MNVNLSKQLLTLENELEQLYDQEEVLKTEVDTTVIQLKQLLKKQLIVEADKQKKDFAVEQIKLDLVQRILTPYNLEVSELNTIEVDRIVLMFRNENKASLEEKLNNKVKGINFGDLKVSNGRE